MWARNSSWFAAVSLLVFACSPDGTAAGPARRSLADAAPSTEPPPDAPTSPASPVPTAGIAPTAETPPVVPLPSSPLVAAFTETGALAVVDPSSGQVLAESPGGGGLPADVAFDAPRARIVTIETDEDDGGGEVAVYALGAGHALGPRTHLVWVDGRMRVLPVVEGLVAFEEGYAERWKLLATQTPGVAAHRPTSAWPESAWGTTLVNALVATRGDGTTSLAWVSADVATSGIAAPITRAALDEPWPDRTDARLVPRGPLASPILVERTSGDLAIRSATAAGFGPAIVVAAGVSGRIEAAVALDSTRLAVALSEPPRIGFVSLADPVQPSWSAVALGSAPIRSDRLPERDLAPLGPQRVLVATTGGVVSVSLVNGDARLDAPFAGGALRGPLATIE